MANILESVRVEFGELGPLVGVEQIEHHPALDAGPAPVATPHFIDPREPVRIKIALGRRVEHFESVEEVRRIKVGEVPAGRNVCVVRLKVRQEVIKHRRLVVERPELDRQ